MELLNSILPTFNALTLVVFVGLLLAAAAPMLRRYTKIKRAHIKVPVLLRRDIVLFGALALYFGSVLPVLLLHIEGLAREWWWVMPRAIIVLSAMAYWVWVEWHLED